MGDSNPDCLEKQWDKTSQDDSWPVLRDEEELTSKGQCGKGSVVASRGTMFKEELNMVAGKMSSNQPENKK